MSRPIRVVVGLAAAAALTLTAAGCTSINPGGPMSAADNNTSSTATTASSLAFNTDPDPYGVSSMLAANSSLSAAYAASVSSAAKTSTAPSAAPSTPPIMSTPPGSTGPSIATSAAASTTTAPSTPANDRFTWQVTDPVASQTVADKAAITAAAPIFRGYLAIYDDSAREPRAKDWQPVMVGYAAGQALTDWRTSWQGYVKYGLTQRGTTAAQARVEGAGLTTAGIEIVSVRACMDLSQIDVYDQAGNKVPQQNLTPTNKGFAWLFTLKQTNGQMRVDSIVMQLPSGKPIPC